MRIVYMLKYICWKDKRKKDMYFGVDENLLYFTLPTKWNTLYIGKSKHVSAKWKKFIHTKVYIFLPFIFSTYLSDSFHCSSLTYIYIYIYICMLCRKYSTPLESELFCSWSWWMKAFSRSLSIDIEQYAERVIPIVVLETILVAFVVVLVAFDNSIYSCINSFCDLFNYRIWVIRIYINIRRILVCFKEWSIRVVREVQCNI